MALGWGGGGGTGETLGGQIREPTCPVLPGISRFQKENPLSQGLPQSLAKQVS